MQDRCKDCKHCGLYETSHEWLDDWCYKKHKTADSITKDEADRCELFKGKETENEKDCKEN